MRGEIRKEESVFYEYRRNGVKHFMRGLKHLKLTVYHNAADDFAQNMSFDRHK